MGAPASPAAPPASARPRVVILGAGFAGLYAARALRRAPVDITLIDRANHHLFQPLLYQVATASLSPADIAGPIRSIVRRQRNCRVMLADATGIDRARRVVRLTDAEVGYDYLVVATGATHAYFGHDEWAPMALGLKTIDDALAIRQKFLLSFEAAEREPDPAARRAILTFVVVGGGPTGVELAGAMAEIARRAMPSEFRSIDPATARIILIEGQDRLLKAYPPELSDRARRDLESMGVDVWTSARVTHIEPTAVHLGEERLAARNVFWAAGVRGSPIAQTLGTALDRAGRVMVTPDLRVPGDARVLVVGDLAHVVKPGTEEEVPGVAPAAMQMGRYVARLIDREARGKPAPAQAFRYVDKGNLATIGRARAVGLLGNIRLTGFLAWAVWLGVHLMYLIGFRNRVLVLIQWAWAYFTFQRGARLITGPAVEELQAVRATKAPAPSPKVEEPRLSAATVH